MTTKKTPALTPAQKQKQAQIKAQQKAAAQTKSEDSAIDAGYGQGASGLGTALVDKFGLEKKGALGLVSTNVPGATETLQRDQSLLGSAGPSATETDTISRMQAGLGGYTSPEYQAQREQMQKGVSSDTATAASGLAKAQARGKVYGAAGAAQNANLQTASLNSKNDLEQQLMVKNIDEMQSRLKDYGAYGFQVAGQAQNQKEVATKDYNTDESNLAAGQLDREKTNIGSEDARLAAAVGLTTGAGSTITQKAQNKASNDIQKQGLAVLAKQ